MAAKAKRFALVGPDGAVEAVDALDPTVPLCRALTRAGAPEAELGSWFVREYEDDIFRVERRKDNPIVLVHRLR